MGVIKIGSGSYYDEPKNTNNEVTVRYESLPNPKPDNYTILRSETMGKYLVIEVQYHDCTNYEGRKIMVFECSWEALKKQKLIDPHFSDNKKYHSPIARFEPTERGWFNACTMCNVLLRTDV